MGLSGTIFKINGNFGENHKNFPTLVYLAPLLWGMPLLRGSHWNFVKVMGSKNYNNAHTRMSRKYDDICIHLYTILALGRQTGGRNW